jgi:hypothetical protein
VAAKRLDTDLDIPKLMTLQHYVQEEDVQPLRAGFDKAGFTD